MICVKYVSLRFVAGIIIGFATNRLINYVTMDDLSNIASYTNSKSIMVTNEKHSGMKIMHSSSLNSNKHVQTHIQQQIPTSTEPDIIHRYDEYTHFAMEWKGIMEEYDWAYNNVHRRERSNDTFNKEYFHLSSTSHSRIFINGDKNNFKKGDYIHIVIKTKDKYGNYRDKGGDMFQGVMLNAQLQKSTAGRVYDYGNGTYSIYFYAAWAGDANISIYMVYTREMILMFNNNRLRKEYLQWTGVYGEDPNSEEVTCKLIREGVWEDKCSYGNRNSFGNIVFVCDKPKTFSCKDIMSVTSFTGKTVNGADAKKERLLLSYLFNNQQNTLLTTMPMRIAVKDTSANVPTLPMCGPDLPIPVTDGYWTDDSTYVSLVCRSQKWTQAQAHKCLANVSLALYGDSTLGQFGQSLRFRYNYSNFIVVSKGFFPHGPTFWTIGYESEFLDGINKTLCDSKQIVFVMNIIFHYTEWSFMLYIERLFATKLAVERLFMRCPTAKVFFKVSHPRSVLGGTQSRFDVVWVAFDMDRMIRRVFGGMGVHFLGVWDMSISHFSSLQVHLAPELIDQQINLLLSYICPDLVD